MSILPDGCCCAEVCQTGNRLYDTPWTLRSSTVYAQDVLHLLMNDNGVQSFSCSTCWHLHDFGMSWCCKTNSEWLVPYWSTRSCCCTWASTQAPKRPVSLKYPWPVKVCIQEPCGTRMSLQGTIKSQMPTTQMTADTKTFGMPSADCVSNIHDTKWTLGL